MQTKKYIDLRRGKGYLHEIKKINRDDSHLSVTITHEAAATKKMRLRVTGYCQGEYLCSLSNEGLIMNYKDYEVKQQKTHQVMNNETS